MYLINNVAKSNDLPYQIIIPMSGLSERFKKQGYKVPKSLIHIEGKPIIAHILDLFPGETDIIFICNQTHLSNPSLKMRELLNEICPSAQVIGISSHRKGPVYAVSQIFDLIHRERPVIVNYCDFSCYWNWHDFKNFARETTADGILPAYRGFHPHSLGKTNYAYIREENRFALDIQEKKSFTRNRMNEFASSGTYYFSSGDLMIEAFRYQMENNLSTKDEYYVSLSYHYLFQKNKKVAVYELEHFMQWGTPEDVQEYRMWSSYFKLLLKFKNSKNAMVDFNLIPMAGLGKRFSDEGYTTSKPLISVSGSPMIAQSLATLPRARHTMIILRENQNIMNSISEIFSKNKQSLTSFVTLDNTTDGQARTIFLGFMQGNIKDSHSVNVGVCDSGVLYNKKKFEVYMNDPDIDIIVWSRVGYCNAIRNPHMYSWLKVTQENIIVDISVKKPFDSPQTDPVITGIFTFKRASHLRYTLDDLFNDPKGKVNGEYYVDSCLLKALKRGLRCKALEVDAYLCWGTPNDLKTFEYWQSCFDKWRAHPYSLNRDFLIKKKENLYLKDEYKLFNVKYPG